MKKVPVEENDVLEIHNFDRYVDAQFNPILNADGRSLFDAEVVDNPENDLSPAAKKLLQSVFELTVKQSKERMKNRSFPT